MRNLPPPLPAKATVGSPSKTGWFVLFVDATDEVLLYHGRTGHVRLAPWISLRDEYGCVYLGNLLTRVTQWFPPKLWMRENLARPPVHDIDVPYQRVDDLQSIALCLASAQARSSKLTRLVNRMMVEGGDLTETASVCLTTRPTRLTTISPSRSKGTTSVSTGDALEKDVISFRCINCCTFGIQIPSRCCTPVQR